MKTIEFAPHGLAVADAEAELFVRSFFKHPGQSLVCVSTSNVLYAARALVHEKIYPHNQLQFLFEGSILAPDERGRLNEWPRGFSDYIDGWLIRLIDEPPA